MEQTTISKHSPRLSFFVMIADSVRHNILEFLLNRKEATVSEIIEAVGKPQTLVSYHLRCLRECGLVNGIRSKDDGRKIMYSIHDKEFVTKLFNLADNYLETHKTCESHSACNVKSNK